MSLEIYICQPACTHCGREQEKVWERNITYNLGPMWGAAGVPFNETIEGKTGKEVLPSLEKALVTLLAEPERFRAMNPSSGLGTYEELVADVSEMIDAVKKWPNGVIKTWR